MKEQNKSNIAGRYLTCLPACPPVCLSASMPAPESACGSSRMHPSNLTSGNCSAGGRLGLFPRRLLSRQAGVGGGKEEHAYVFSGGCRERRRSGRGAGCISCKRDAVGKVGCPAVSTSCGRAALPAPPSKLPAVQARTCGVGEHAARRVLQQLRQLVARLGVARLAQPALHRRQQLGDPLAKCDDPGQQLVGFVPEPTWKVNGGAE